jgi:MFS family permease
MWQMLGQASPRRFFIAWTQSAVGTGAGYVALLLLAYQTFHSPWAVAAILLAEHLPCMLLGPVLGAVVDRVPRRTAAIAADLIGCAAFLGLALAASFPVVLGQALLAGVGVALAQPAAMAGLPEVVEPEHLPAATSLHTGIEEAGVVIGPLVAALVLAGADPSALMLANGLSFGLSAVLLASVRFTPRAAATGETADSEPAVSLAGSTRTGLRALRGMPGVRTLVLTSTVAVFAYGMLNVAELLFARDELGVGDSGFSLLIGTMSVGMMVGALAGARSRDGRVWRREYLLGLALMGVTMLAVGGAHSVAFALPMLLLCGYGNGITIVHERLLLQHTVPSALHGRVFGIRRMLVSWSFCGSYLLGGAVAASAGPRMLLFIAGTGMLCAFAWGVLSLRGSWVSSRALAGTVPAAPAA